MGPPLAPHRGFVRRAGEIEQVLPFGLVELKCCRDRMQHGFGGSRKVAAFKPGVVLDADAGKRGDFGAA